MFMPCTARQKLEVSLYFITLTYLAHLTAWKMGNIMLYVFFWVIPRRLNFICRCFGKLCLFHLNRLVGDE